jgi:hypothetical protein
VKLDRLEQLGRGPRRALGHVRGMYVEWSRPRWLLDARREARALRRDYPGFAADLNPGVGVARGRVLLVSLSDDPEQIRLEAILAKALQVHGGHVTVLAYRRGAPRASAMLPALGLNDVVRFEDLAPSGAMLDAEVATRLEQCRTAGDFKSFEVLGARVGRQALASVVRRSREPTLDLDDPAIRAAIHDTVAYAVRSIHVADRALDLVQPDCVVTVERGYAGFGSISDRALVRGIPVIQFQAAHRDDAFYLKRYALDSRGLHPRSLDRATWENLQEVGLTEERERLLWDEMAAQEAGKWFLARRNRAPSERRCPDELRRRLGLDGERKVAVLFSHILWDASMFYGTDVYPDQGRWFAETLRLAAEDARVQWLIKLHPALFWTRDGARAERDIALVHETIGELPSHMKLLTPDAGVSNADLFQIVDAGVTIRGTVGIELPPLGVPVITAGTSDYSGKGFTIDAATIAEYEANVRSIHGLGRLTAAQVELAKLYAFGIFCARPWTFESFALDYQPSSGSSDTLDQHLRYNIRTRAELERADDLRRFANWVLRSSDADFVDERLLKPDRRAVPAPR